MTLKCSKCANQRENNKKNWNMQNMIAENDSTLTSTFRHDQNRWGRSLSRKNMWTSTGKEFHYSCDIAFPVEKTPQIK